jgi:gamma-glutamylcyclotransferase (GGCT)/AIG2-like uncharacterized protein YtfP
MTKKREFYFAYGSNLDVTQMLQRCPSAKFIGKAVLNNHRLEIRKHMDIDQVQGEQVEGIVYSMTKQDIAVLDRYEGVPYSYNKLRVTVKVGNLIVPNVVSYMKNKANIEYILPTKVYYNRVRNGLIFWGLSTKPLETALTQITRIVAQTAKRKAKVDRRFVDRAVYSRRSAYRTENPYGKRKKDTGEFRTETGGQFDSWDDYCKNYVDDDFEAFNTHYAQYKAKKRGMKHYQELYANPKDNVSEAIDLG